MTKTQALNTYFNSYGMKAYPDTVITSETSLTFPYMTYTVTTGGFEDVAVLTVNLWYHTTSEAAPNAKAEEISKDIGSGGKLLECDDGYLWIKRGSPFCQNLTDQTDPSMKRRYLNIIVEYLSK